MHTPTGLQPAEPAVYVLLASGELHYTRTSSGIHATLVLNASSHRLFLTSEGPYEQNMLSYHKGSDHQR